MVVIIHRVTNNKTTVTPQQQQKLWFRFSFGRMRIVKIALPIHKCKWMRASNWKTIQLNLKWHSVNRAIFSKWIYSTKPHALYLLLTITIHFFVFFFFYIQLLLLLHQRLPDSVLLVVITCGSRNRNICNVKHISPCSLTHNHCGWSQSHTIPF